LESRCSVGHFPIEIGGSEPAKSKEAIMYAIAHKRDFSPARRLTSWTNLLPRFGKHSAPKLDLESLPDHLKRDLGFLGGRETPPRDVLRD
jgi:hypothetical protein